MNNAAAQADLLPVRAPVATIPLTLTLPDTPDVTVCLAFTDLAGPALDAAASPLLWKGEQARADRFLRDRARADFLRGRLAAKTALSALCQIPAASLNIENGVFRQPVVSAPFGHLGVSLSHGAGGALAVAFPNRCPLGVDLERINPDRINVLRSWIPHAEEQMLSSFGLTSVQALTAAWSAREALSKILGGGLSIDMAMLAIEQDQDVDNESKNIQKTLKSNSKHLKLVAPFVGHLRVELRVSATAALALALPRTATCAWPIADEWLASLDARGGATS